jgi:hypothetical protein
MELSELRGDPAAVSAALDSIRSSLEVDGYRLEVTAATDTLLAVRVLATASACEECLVPAEVLKMIISGGLEGAYVPDQIDVALPPVTAHEDG